jgi:inosine-uridine nucleoside N-ribohydrolase
MTASRRVRSLLCSALAACLLPDQSFATPSNPPPEPVIIDTDVGDDLDDAFALAVALSNPRLEILGITTAWGDTRTRVLLVRRLLATVGRGDLVVAQGPITADSVVFTQRQWAMGASDTSAAPDAIEFIRTQVKLRPGQITLIALAPLSNVQALQARDPEALHKLKQVIMMGGSIYAGYNKAGVIPNIEPSAEYNVASAPKALADLLQSGVPITMFPLDSTQIKFDEVQRDRLFAYGSPLSDALTLLYHQWRSLNSWGQITPTLFDVVPITSMLAPTTCPLTALRITVDEQGMTRPTEGTPNIRVCLKVDQAAVQRLVIHSLAP